MDDKTAIKNSFKGLLPRGFTSIIQKRVQEATGTKYSLSQISRVCDADTQQWNKDIIAEAVKLAKEENTILGDLKAKAAAI